MKEEWLTRIKNHESLSSAPPHIRADIDVVRAAVEQDGNSIMYASDELRDNKEIAMLAIENSFYILPKLSIRLQSDPEIVMRIITRNPSFLANIPRFKNNKDFMLEAVAQNPEIIKYASPELREGGLRAYINELLKSPMKELMTSAQIKSKQDYDARMDGAIVHTPPYAKLFDHGPYHGQLIGKHIASFLIPHEIVVRASKNLDRIEKQSVKKQPTFKKCEDNSCSVMGGKKRKSRRKRRKSTFATK